MPRLSPSVLLPRLLSKWGVCSRKEAERLVVAGRVTVNGRVRNDVLFAVVPAHDRVEVDGAVIGPAARLLAVLHKPVGVVTTMRDPQGRSTVKDLLPVAFRGAMPVGRLDRDSSGLLLVTNDHDLANRVAGDRSRVPKVYHVLVTGTPEERALAPLRAGMMLDGTRCRPAEVRILRSMPGGTLLEIVLREGRNRQIRRSCGALGLPVRALQRVAIGPLDLGDLPPGRLRALTAAESAALAAAAGVTGRSASPPVPPSRGRAFRES